jgi:predicted nucleic acid-binding protein
MTIAHSRALPHAPRLFRLSAWKRIDAATAPASWQAELLSVLWMAVRTKVITSEDSVTKLKAAASLGILTVPVRQLWRGALRRSIDSEISPYDILFIELAIRRKQKLATFDRQLLRAFPDIRSVPPSCDTLIPRDK